jgi:hypothetical protein
MRANACHLIKVCSLSTILLVWISPLIHGTTLVQTDGPADGAWTGIIGVDWQQTVGESNVSISVPFFLEPGAPVQPPSSVHAYLTTSIGPETILADQVAASTVSVLPSAGPSVSYVIFSGLSLSPGSYFLTINDTGTPVGSSRESVGWAGEAPATQATISTSPGFSNVGFYTLNGYQAQTAYDPADPLTPLISFSVTNVQESAAVNFEASGDPVSAAPEPSAGSFIILGFAIASCWKLHRSLARITSIILQRSEAKSV